MASWRSSQICVQNLDVLHAYFFVSVLAACVEGSRATYLVRRLLMLQKIQLHHIELKLCNLAEITYSSHSITVLERFHPQVHLVLRKQASWS